MDFGKALTFPFEDDEWLPKLGIATVVSWIPIVNFALGGWMIALIRNIKNNDEMPLPAWDDFGGFFMKGLLMAVAYFIYYIPGGVLIGGGSFGLSYGSSGEDGAAIALIIGACCLCIGLLILIAAMLTYFGGLIRFADTESFGTFMEFGANFGLVRDNLSPFLMALLYYILGSILLSIVAAIPLGLGYLVLTAVMTYFGGHLLGQVASQVGSAGDAMPAM